MLQKVQKGNWRLLVTLAAFAAAVAGLMVLLSLLGGGGGSREVFAGVRQDGTRLGREEAPVTIELYEDFQCPAYGQFARETLPEVVERHVQTGDAKLVSETLVFIGPDSLPAARAAFAAGEQDLYWQYAALLFENQGAENSGYVTDEFLTNLAGETEGLDVAEWDEARRGGFEEELRAAQQRAGEDVVNSTPSLVVSGPGGETTLRGAVPIEDVDRAVEEVGGVVGVRERHHGLRALLAALAAAGFAISAYLTWAHLSGAVPVCVGGSGGCETVQTSRYSEILGIPVAALGLFAYAAMLICAGLRGEGAAVSGVFVGLVGTLFSAYLTYLELFVLRAICQWCVASALLMVAYLALGALRLRDPGTSVPETAGGR